LLMAAAAFGLSLSNPRFDALLSSLSLPEPALTLVDSPAQRTLLRGSSAVQEDPLVRRAFQILYEDLAIFRPAGNILAGKLASCADVATDLYQCLANDLSSAIALPSLDAVLPSLRGVFDCIDADGDGSLDPHELQAAAAQSALEPVNSAAQLCLDAGGEGCSVAYSFAEFVAVVAPHAANRDAMRCSLIDAAHEASDALDRQLSPAAASSASPRKGGVRGGTDGWGGRFDRMVAEFLLWEVEVARAPAAAEEVSPQGARSRTAEIVDGCFAGAHNAELLDALRLVYCENAVLRQCGDLVFRMLRPPSARRA